jgi:division protein CdvB (Snf7/Vps24/ESCRT-III family)
MAHFNTHTINVGDKFIKTYTILNLTPEQLHVLNNLIQNLPIPQDFLEIAANLKTQIANMANEVSVTGNEAGEKIDNN